ncbi:zinc mynd-type containing 12 family protein [Cystoisospora suis]|uniref:Zinc mynd-type containing 12 family protein n=1 Tax=Cystoisospora suis TaxID=483139 RepID=A0A2C6LCC3_9APIC|nr:zinc mynd-type containing 12 family protein [Cystoisospora suis]
MSAVKIQRLALPKGVNLKCEICGEPATFRCLECPTFYCTQEHFETDWYGVLHRIHRDVTALREERKTVGTEKDRQQREKDLQAIRRKVLEVSRATAQKCVVQGKYQYAAAGALYALKMAEVLYGQDAPEVVAAHLLLAEIHLGLQRLQSAEELLTLVRSRHTHQVLGHARRGLDAGTVMRGAFALERLKSLSDLSGYVKNWQE